MQKLLVRAQTDLRIARGVCLFGIMHTYAEPFKDAL